VRIVKIFSIVVSRKQTVKLLIGIAVLAYLARIVMGLTNQHTFGGVTFFGLTELFFALLALSAVLLLLDIRDQRNRGIKK